jgi:hypothetical protein
MAAIHTEVMKSAGDFHGEIGKTFFGVAEHIFNNPATLDACNGIFYQDPCTRDNPV